MKFLVSKLFQSLCFSILLLIRISENEDNFRLTVRPSLSIHVNIFKLTAHIEYEKVSHVDFRFLLFNALHMGWLIISLGYLSS